MNDAALDVISRELLIPRDELTEDTRLDSFTLDSIDVMSLIAALDTEFQLTIRPEHLQRFVTVGDIAEYVEAHAGSAPSGTPQSF
jgi:acyl carrier protein